MNNTFGDYKIGEPMDDIGIGFYRATKGECEYVCRRVTEVDKNLISACRKTQLIMHEGIMPQIYVN